MTEEKLLHNTRCAARRVIVAQKPLFLRNASNNFCRSGSNTLSRPVWLLVPQTAEVKEFWEIFHCPLYYFIMRLFKEALSIEIVASYGE
jgi:hypothetical protein